MKVSVCFGSTRVIVPCGDGNFPVRDLVEKAITRYKKATGKPSTYWVTVHNVKTSEDGGILDPDDTVSAVADDREQISASFEEQGGPPAPHNGGDGASASSVGTASPDIFSGEITVIPVDNHDVIVTPNDLSTGSALTVRRGSEPALNNIGQDTEKIPDYSNTGTFPKKAKRWSAIVTPIHGGHFTSTPKRENDSSDDDTTRKIPLRVGGNGQDKNLFNRFARDSWRQSLSNQPNMFKWLEAQERQEDKYSQDTSERSEPVGGLATSGSSESDQSHESTAIEQNGSLDGTISVILQNSGGPLGIHVVPDFDESGSDTGLMIQSIEKGGRVHKDGRMKVQDRIVEINGTPLLNVNFAKAQSIFKKAMQSPEIRLRVLKHEAPPPLPKQPPPVLPKGRSPRNPAVPPRPSPLTLPSSSQAETASEKSSDSHSDTDTQRTSSSVDTVNEKTPGNSNSNSGTDATVYSSDNNSRTTNNLNSQDASPSNVRHAGKSAHSVTFNTTNNSHSNSNGKPSARTSHQKSNMPIKPGPPIKAGGAAAINGTRRVPPLPPARHPSTSLSPSASLTSTSSTKERGLTAPTNTRKIGKKINIQLVKGPLGLGFSITTRDNPAGGNCPIYIKNILPKGAAIIDGRLKPGDRLLEVNGQPMTGKTQAEAVNILRNTKLGSSVHIVVSRQTEDKDDDMFKVPRELTDQLPVVNLQPPEKVNNNDDPLAGVPQNRQLIELDIPLNDTGSAGLGVSVKGKTQTHPDGNVTDLGIFIKAVIHGGAASKDGRLAINDQLLEVNNNSLVRLPNTDAMETLRKAMQSEGSTPGFINIKVARKIGAPSPSTFGEEEREFKIRTFSETSDTSNVSQVETDPRNDSSDSVDTSFENPNNQTVQPGYKVKGNLNSSKNIQIQNNNNNLKPHNPLLDRLRNNNNNGGGNRNDSYNRAVHDSLNDSSLSKISSLDGSTHPEPKPRLPRGYKQTIPTVSINTQETVIIEQEDPYAQVQKFGQNSKLRPHSTIGIMRTNSYSSSSQSNEDGRPPSPPDWLRDWDKRRSQAKEDLSPAVDPMKAFQREGFGRQSMSEKRKIKASIDPRTSEYYHRAKQAQHDLHRGTAIPSPGPLTRAGSAESLLGRTNISSVHDDRSYPPSAIGPTLGMKKSTSLESLETAMQDVGVDNSDEAFWGRGRNARHRGCNESFRAAVDRSYDPSKLQLHMDIVEEDSSEGGSIQQGRRNGSSRSSLSSDQQDDTLKRKKKEKEKKGGIFKGIFKFGRNRKTVENLRASPFENNRSASTTEWVKQASDQGERSHSVKPPSNQEQVRLEDHYRRLQEKQRHIRENEMHGRDRLENHNYQHQQNQQQQQQQRLYGYLSNRDIQDQENQMPDFSMDRSVQNLPAGAKSEKIQQLRSEHQRRHRERQGHYPLEEQEEHYEREIQREERRVPIDWRYGESKAPPNVLDLPVRKQSEDRSDYESSSRPSSRLGFSDNINYSHYQNQDEIQDQMRRHDNYTDHQYGRQARQREPHSGSQLPHSISRQPIPGNPQPHSGNYQPHSGSQQPHSGNYQPHSGSQQPHSGNYQHRSASHQPHSGNNQPHSGHFRQPIGPPLSGRSDPYGHHGEPRRQPHSTGNVRAYTPIPQMYTQSHHQSYGQIGVHQRSVSYDEYDDPRNAYRDPQPGYGYGQSRQLNPSSAKV